MVDECSEPRHQQIFFKGSVSDSDSSNSQAETHTVVDLQNLQIIILHLACSI